LKLGGLTIRSIYLLFILVTLLEDIYENIFATEKPHCRLASVEKEKEDQISFNGKLWFQSIRY